MATSSGSSRQPLAPERPSRVSGRSGKEAQGQPARRRRDKHHQRQRPRRSQEQEYTEEDEEEGDDDNIDEETGLSRDEAALIDARFHRAVDIIQSLPKSGPITTTYEEKLMLYSLYKQATEGPVKVPRPSLLDLLGRAKWDAWKKRESLSKPQAQESYVETLLGILKGFSDKPESVRLINELRNFGASETDEQTDDFESITSSQRSMSPPSTSRRTFHSAVPSNVEQSSLQGDVTPKRRPTRQTYEHPAQGRTSYPETEEEEETVSDHSSDNDEHDQHGRHVYARQYDPRQPQLGVPGTSRPSPYHHPAQYPAPVSAQLPPHLPPAADPRRQQATGLHSTIPQRPLNTLRYGTAASAVPSLSAFPPDANVDLQSVHSRQSSGFNNPSSRMAAAQMTGGAGSASGPSASLPNLPSQSASATAANTASIITARQANLDRALDSIQTSLAAMHERLTQIEHAQTEQNHHALHSSSSSSGILSNSPVFQLLKLMFNKLLSFLHLKRPSASNTSSTSLGTLLSRALVSILMSIRDLSRDAVAVVFLAAAIAALRNARGDWRAVIRSWTRIMAMASGLGWAREGLMLGGGQ